MSDREFENYLILLSHFLKLSDSQRDAIAAELRDHLEERLAALEHHGLSRDEAVREALEEFGDAAGLASQLTLTTGRRIREQKRRWMMRLTTSSLVIAVLAILTVMIMWPDPVPGPQPGRVQAQRNQTEESPADAERSSPAARVELSVDTERTRQILRQKTDFDLVDVPLVDVVAWLEETTNLNIVLDARPLEDVGVDPISSTLSLSAKKMSYAAALRHLLGPHDLQAVVQREILQITTMEVAESTLSTKLYPVWDLARLPAGDREAKADYESLRELITLTVVPGSWDEVGGPASIVPYKGMLTISQIDSAHEEIERLLESMRRFPRVEDVIISENNVAPGIEAIVMLGYFDSRFYQ